ncbi:hypothetical protein MYX84_12155, partial [Acidobacteria bacterium AH-259-O06]|nr:hypothetical protein [Acidobacteria bacterium AH-259-O06]
NKRVATSKRTKNSESFCKEIWVGFCRRSEDNHYVLIHTDRVEFQCSFILHIGGESPKIFYNFLPGCYANL